MPPSIKDHYRHPIGPPPPASYEDFRHYSIPVPHPLRIQENMKSDDASIISRSVPRSLNEEESLWLRSLIDLQSDIALAIEKDKLKHLVSSGNEANQPAVAAPVKSTPKTLKELASRMCALQQAQALRNDCDVFGRLPTINNSHKAEKRKLEAGQPAKPFRSLSADSPSKRRNSDPQLISSMNLIESSSKRSKLLDGVTVYRPLTLPNRNVPFAKLELRRKTVAPSSFKRTVSLEANFFNGEADVLSSKNPSMKLESLVADASKKSKTNSWLDAHRKISDSSITIKDKMTIEKNLPLVNGVSEEMVVSDDEVHQTGNLVYQSLLFPAYFAEF